MSKFLGKIFLFVGCISGSMLMGMQIPVKNTDLTIISGGAHLRLVNTKTGAHQNHHSFSYPMVSAKLAKDRQSTVKIKLKNGGIGWIAIRENVLKN